MEQVCALAGVILLTFIYIYIYNRDKDDIIKNIYKISNGHKNSYKNENEKIY